MMDEFTCEIGNSICSLALCDSAQLLLNWPASLDLIVTDPPYGISYKSGCQSVDRKVRVASGVTSTVRANYFSAIKGDDKAEVEWLGAAYRALNPTGALYLFCSWHNFGIFKEAAEKVGFAVKNMIVLSKSNHGMGDLRGQFAPKHELMIYATKGRHKLNFTNGRKSDVWDVPVMFSGRRRLHPNQKPVPWYSRPIEYSCPEGGLVCDPFMGSGTCAEAAIKERVNFVGCDVDPQYYSVSVSRIEALRERK